jgi:tRNA-specific 2-thiouridylase
MKKPTIAVGLSGGVDSAAAACLLKQQGYDLMGIFMQNWQTHIDDPYCTADQDIKDAQSVCEILSIPFHVVNFSKEYWDRVFKKCLDDFAQGLTPNPDIGCNREIKFNVFLTYAIELGASKLATGHYARIIRDPKGYQLHKGEDSAKDQSYFLYTLNQYALSHTLFPLGDLTKSKVRTLAEQAGLKNAHKKDSTGICFIGARKFNTFLKQFMLTKVGNIETVHGKVIGQHEGLMFYTLGQRHGLNIGGQANTNNAPWYVLQKDMKRNVLIAGQGKDNPLLYTQTLQVKQLHWIQGEPVRLPYACWAKIRYRQLDQVCTIDQHAERETLNVLFEKPQRAVTPGQSIVFYQGNLCLGGGVIISSV